MVLLIESVQFFSSSDSRSMRSILDAWLHLRFGHWIFDLPEIRIDRISPLVFDTPDWF